MLEHISLIAREAGAAVMAIYRGENPLDLSYKSDHSPVTAADLGAHKIIKHRLLQLTPQIPLLSEEDPATWDVRRYWQCYWLVDPLDGTKEFINRNGEFTVNIALIQDGVPILGVVYVPVRDLLYGAEVGKAWKEQQGERVAIRARYATPPLVVISRSHVDAALSSYLNTLGKHQVLSVGSSLKFCLVAEGIAQLYPRFGPTHIWDTAAGHAVVLAAGAQVRDWQGRILNYTPVESMLNPGFQVSLD